MIRNPCDALHHVLKDPNFFPFFRVYPPVFFEGAFKFRHDGWGQRSQLSIEVSPDDIFVNGIVNGVRVLKDVIGL